MVDFKHSQDEYIAYFVEYPQSKFTSVSGGERTNESNTVHTGGGGKTNVDGPSDVSEVTLQKPYDHAIDAPLNQWDRLWQNGFRQQLTLIVQPVDSTGIPVGEADTYTGCSRTGYAKPDIEKGSSEEAMLEVTVNPEDVQ